MTTTSTNYLICLMSKCRHAGAHGALKHGKTTWAHWGEIVKVMR